MKKKILRYLMLVLSLLIAAAIFLFSAENGEKSGNLSDKLAEKILQIFGITDENSSEENQAETIVSVGSVFRKLAHFIEYFALGGAVCGFFLTYSMTPLRCIWLSSGISVISVIHAILPILKAKIGIFPCITLNGIISMVLPCMPVTENVLPGSILCKGILGTPRYGCSTKQYGILCWRRSAV